ncbi:hypothetical protein BJX70DRAFT_75108 [Aspergillus crustosus]
MTSIIWRNDPNPNPYEKARTKRLFNALVPPRFPLAIASVSTEEQIRDTVQIAISKNCRISVRAGGHSYAAWSLRDDAILIEMGDYHECQIDRNGVVRVSPSLTGRELTEYLYERGRVFPVGHCPEVGVGGYLLGGGMGWNQTNLEWACEHVVALDVVTASGESVKADAQQNSDLFWAARGGGPAFPGVVTRFYLQTLPAPKIMRTSGYVYPVENYATILNWALTTAAGFKDSIEIVAIGSCQEGIDTPCLTIALIAFGDDETHLQNLLDRVESSRPAGAISAWTCRPTTLPEQFNLKARSYPPNHRYYVDNAFINNHADITDTLEQAFTTLPTRKSLALWSSMIPLSRRRKQEAPDMALSIQSDHYFALYAIWEDEKEDLLCKSWLDAVMQEVGVRSVGSYLGELDFRSRLGKYWGEEEYQRLLEIRRKWDPEGRIPGCLGLDDTG